MDSRRKNSKICQMTAKIPTKFDKRSQKKNFANFSKNCGNKYRISLYGSGFFLNIWWAKVREIARDVLLGY